MIGAVISDFGGVLTSPLINGFLAYQERTGVSPEDLGRAMEEARRRHGEHPLFQLERGEITEAEFGRRLRDWLPDGFDFAHLRETYFEQLHPNAPMIDYMRELRGRGVRMALCTNNVREWEPLWRSKLPELDQIFEVVVDSAFVGTRKPEPRIFEITLERLGGDLRFEDCVLVDDLAPNCDAARELGMGAVRFQETAPAIAELEALLNSGT
jgi:putative hydrolase of the HAD superfamily